MDTPNCASLPWREYSISQLKPLKLHLLIRNTTRLARYSSRFWFVCQLTHVLCLQPSNPTEIREENPDTWVVHQETSGVEETKTFCREPNAVPEVNIIYMFEFL